MSLTEAKIRNPIRKSQGYRIADGDGLYLLIGKSGTKRWVFRYRFAGKEKSISLGKYPHVGLAEAREKKHEARKLLDKGGDPCVEKRKSKIHAEFQSNNTFRAAAKEWHEMNKAAWTEEYSRKVWRQFENYIFPQLGNMPVAEIEPIDVLRVIQKIERTGATYVSRRMAESCKRVFSYSICTARIKHNPAADLNAALLRHRAQHYPTLRPSEIQDFLRAYERLNSGEIYKLAFKLLLLTALRTSELRYSKWENVNFQTREWLIPKELMKMREAHVVFLSRQAIGLLRRLQEMTGYQEWLFLTPNPRKHPVISENFATNMIEEMGYKSRIVGHGFRALFSTVCNENKKSRDAVERQLAHRERNPSRAAYNRAEYYEERRELMQWWADHLDSLAVAETADAGLQLGHFPRGGAMAEFKGRGVDPRFDSAIPGAFAHRDDFESLVQRDKPLMN